MRSVRTVITLDNDTGDVQGMTTTYVSQAKREPFYVKTYIDGIEKLYSMRPYCWPVLIWMLRRMPYASEDQRFEFGLPMRKKAASELGMSLGRVNHAVTDLVESGAVLRVDRGLYQLNPMIFGRGEWKEIARLRETASKIAEDEKNPAKKS